MCVKGGVKSHQDTTCRQRRSGAQPAPEPPAHFSVFCVVVCYDIYIYIPIIDYYTILVNAQYTYYVINYFMIQSKYTRYKKGVHDGIDVQSV